jgi:hypothetical protein
MLAKNGAGSAAAATECRARKFDQRDGKVRFLATPHRNPSQVIRAELIGSDALEAPRPRFGVAPSTLMAAEYLVRLNDPKRLRAWLARHTAEECAAILRHIEEIAAHERNPTGGTHDHANIGRR